MVVSLLYYVGGFFDVVAYDSLALFTVDVLLFNKGNSGNAAYLLGIPWSGLESVPVVVAEQRQKI